MPILFLIIVIDLVGFGIILPLLPFYAVRFQASPLTVTTVMACYSFAQFIASPLLGRLSDRFGRRPILIASLVCSIMGYLWLGFADALWMLFAARLLAGAGGGNIGAAQAYVSDITTHEHRAKGMGMIGAAFGIGFTIGPAIGGILAGSDGTAAALARPAFAAALFSALALVLTLFRLEESLSKRQGEPPPRRGRLEFARTALMRPSLRRLILVGFLTTLAFAGMETTFALWANSHLDWGPREVGRLFFFIGAVLVVVQGGLIGRLARRFGEAALIVAGAVAIAAGLVALPAFPTLTGVLIASGVLALGMGLLNPSMTSLASREAEEDERGGILGVSQSAASLARILGPLIAGAAYQGWGRDVPLLLGAGVMVVVVGLALLVMRR